MKKSLIPIILFTLICTALASCGPSPEEIEQMTMAAWTDTPEPTSTPTPTPTLTPTPTSTPLPYNVAVDVVDEASEPILFAKVQLVEPGDEKQPVNDVGEVQFMNLPGENVTLNVSSPGYFLSSTTHTIERGENTIQIQLEQDPNGLLPENACMPGETYSMVEDFQDQEMQEGWQQLSDRLASGVPFIEIDEDLNQPGNNVLKHFINGELGHYSVLRYDEIIGDAVLRFDLRITLGQHIQVGWHDTQEGRYIAFIFANDDRGGQVHKFLSSSDIPTFNFSVDIADEEWHKIEISTFEGTYSLWIDGVEMGSWQDQQPLEPGAFFVDVAYNWEPVQTTEFDNFSVCELTAPFTTMVVEPEE